MHDTFLFKKIADEVFELCKENHITKIIYLEIEVNHKSHVSKKTLHQHLLEEIPELVDLDTNINVNKNDTEELTAVIKTIEGMNGTLPD